MKVETILSKKGRAVETIRPDRDATAALEKLRAADIGALVVSRDGSSVDGILSERDIVRGLAKLGAGALKVQVQELMTQKVLTCTPEDSTSYLMKLMTEKRIRHVPVVQDGVVCGIVSIGDVVKNRVEELEMEAVVLRDSRIMGS
ncbi:MAG: CBS domain-containing protein [Candidatus Dormiibacterota bacterium]